MAKPKPLATVQTSGETVVETVSFLPPESTSPDGGGVQSEVKDGEGSLQAASPENVLQLRAFPDEETFRAWVATLESEGEFRRYEIDPDEHGNTILVFFPDEEDIINDPDGCLVVEYANGTIISSESTSPNRPSGAATDVGGGGEAAGEVSLSESLPLPPPPNPDPMGHLLTGGTDGIPPAAAAFADGVKSSYAIPRVVTLVFWALLSDWGKAAVARGNYFRLKAIGSETHDAEGWNVFVVGVHSFQFFGRRVESIPGMKQRLQEYRSRRPRRAEITAIVHDIAEALYPEDETLAIQAVKFLDEQPLLSNYSPEVING